MEKELKRVAVDALKAAAKVQSLMIDAVENGKFDLFFELSDFVEALHNNAENAANCLNYPEKTAKKLAKYGQSVETWVQNTVVANASIMAHVAELTGVDVDVDVVDYVGVLDGAMDFLDKRAAQIIDKFDNPKDLAANKEMNYITSALLLLGEYKDKIGDYMEVESNINPGYDDTKGNAVNLLDDPY